MDNRLSHSLIQGFIRQPRSLWLRKAIFQIHLWIGVALALYAIVIGITGSILVFGEELHALSDNHDGTPLHPTVTMAAAAAVVTPTVRGERITLAFPPTSESPGYTFLISNHPAVYVDAASGLVALPAIQQTWLNVVSALHVNLLMGDRGRTINGIAATALLLLAVTGLFLWWPGIASVSRSLRMDLGKGWKRIVWDLHGVSGIYGLGMALMWSLTATLFLLPVARTALGILSPISRPSIPEVRASPNVDTSDEVMLGYVDTAIPTLAGRLRWVVLPEGKGKPITLFVSRELVERRLHVDRFYLDPYTGVRIGASYADEGKSFSDWVLRLVLPLHTGMYWGLFVKVLWAFLGLLFPVLGITGLVMYWNRFLSKKWKQFRRRPSMPLHAARDEAVKRTTIKLHGS